MNNIYDLDFLHQLDHVRTKVKFARITALSFQELPLQQIEGRVTAGSINIDGSSAVRRSCSLTLVAQNFDYRDYYWGLNTKFKLEIGLENTINKDYPDIIWFNQGIYILTQFNLARSTNNFTISLQGKDKMCQLNGEVGGTINAPTDFGTIEEVDGEITLITKLPIKDIIRNMIHTYAGEPHYNIIINDLDHYAVELLEYRYDVPMYLYRTRNSPLYDNATLDGDIQCQIPDKKLKELESQYLETLVDTLIGEEVAEPVTIDGNSYYIAKLEYGNTAGYRETDLVYAGDLIANIGESITSILDKIKNMLGEFEYFYDIDGRFIFQKKQAFVNTLWNSRDNDQESEDYIQHLALASSNIYTFSEGQLITAFNNTPNLLNMRNDYSIWGERTSLSGQKVPVHLRYAIDTQPKYYVSINNVIYRKDDPYDWRELLYQMAIDYLAHNTEDDFEKQIALYNPQYPTGQTGYEQYYTDILGFWRQLYCPSQEEYVNNALKSAKGLTEEEKEAFIVEKQQEYQNTYYTSGERKYWNINVFEHPDLLNFWFDFLDTEGELAAFNVKVVGDRSKAVNDTNIKSIYFRETPDIIFVKDISEIDNQIGGYRYLQFNDDTMFSISAQGKSAKDKLDELIYKHGYCIETASITAIPIYYLQPNTRIRISDKDTNLQGDYIISKMTIPLTYNGTMSITATKAAETIW